MEWAALAGLLLPHVGDLIKGVENLIKGDKKGGDRGDTVLRAVQQLIAGLIQAKIPLSDGSLVTSQPDPEQLKGFIEAAFQNLKSSGVLTGTSKTSWYLVQAASVTPLPL